MSAPTNGPLRSAATEAVTTIAAVIAILSARPYQNMAMMRAGSPASRAGHYIHAAVLGNGSATNIEL